MTPPSAQDMRTYYQQWLTDTAPATERHPYADNIYWQQQVGALQRLIATRGLQHARVLEVGSGMGLLQHLVPNYTGIDLAASSARHVHKSFAAASATQLPFADDTFDAVWTFWVLEHINRPEQMLDEMRRVTKPGGVVFVCAAYAVDSWVSQGIHKRPFGELTLRQRLTKLSVPLRRTAAYKIATTLPVRLAALAGYLRRRRPTALHYRPLTPNFETYWDYDADACVQLDSHSVALYFLSRGDRPLLGGGAVASVLARSQPQAYEIVKGRSQS